MFFTEPIVITRLAPDTSADAGLFEGLASTWRQDRHGDVVARGAFTDSLAALHAGERSIPLLLNHLAAEQLGSIKSGQETDEGLRVQGQLITGSPAADRVYQLAKAGATSLSIGFQPIAGAFEKMPSGGWLHKKVDLLEVSAVACPSNRESRILSIKMLGDTTLGEFTRLLREGGLPPLPRRLADRVAKTFHEIITDDDTDELDVIAAALADLKNTFRR